MGNRRSAKRPLHTIAADYFGYLGRHLPQQCASDEFYFIPRSETAIEHQSILDDLTPERIQDHIRYVQDLLREISTKEAHDLEDTIDRLLLQQSMKSFIREFKEAAKVTVTPNPSSHNGMPHIRFKGAAGTVLGKRGDAYMVEVKAGGKKKTIVAGPEHLTPV